MNRDQFEERAAICEFEGGMSRFAAETAAAREQGMERWQAMREIRDADRGGNPESGGDRPAAVAGHGSAHDLPGVQPDSAQKVGPVSQRLAQAGWAGVVLLALFVQGRGVL